MASYSVYATTPAKASSLLNQFREKDDRLFSVKDFSDCKTEIAVENRYKKLLKDLLDGKLKMIA